MRQARAVVGAKCHNHEDAHCVFTRLSPPESSTRLPTPRLGSHHKLSDVFVFALRSFVWIPLTLAAKALMVTCCECLIEPKLKVLSTRIRWRITYLYCDLINDAYNRSTAMRIPSRWWTKSIMIINETIKCFLIDRVIAWKVQMPLNMQGVNAHSTMLGWIVEWNSSFVGFARYYSSLVYAFMHV